MKLALCALLIFVPVLVLAKECGIKSNSRIVGGVDAQENEFPWQVSWHYYNTTTKTSRHICGASIISGTWILSAAHCVDLNDNVNNIDVKVFRAVVGAHKQSEASANELRIEIAEIIVHPQWDRKKIANDIALVKLSKPIDLDNTKLNAICIGHSTDNIEGENAIISGWGLLKSGDSAIPDTLQKAEVPVVVQSSCKNIYSFITTITDGMVCAGYSVGVCNGDSGGPLSYSKNGRSYLLGATSFGVGCGSSIFPGVFTRVPYYSQFIQDTTGIVPALDL